MKKLKNFFGFIALLMLAVVFYFVNSFLWYQRCRRVGHWAAIQFLGFTIFGVVAFALMVWSYFTPIYPFGGFFRLAALFMYLVPLGYYQKLANRLVKVDIFVVHRTLAIRSASVEFKEWTDKDYYFYFTMDGEEYIGRHGCWDKNTPYAGFGDRGEAEAFVRKKEAEASVAVPAVT